MQRNALNYSELIENRISSIVNRLRVINELLSILSSHLNIEIYRIQLNLDLELLNESIQLDQIIKNWWINNEFLMNKNWTWIELLNELIELNRLQNDHRTAILLNSLNWILMIFSRFHWAIWMNSQQEVDPKRTEIYFLMRLINVIRRITVNFIQSFEY